MTLGLLMLSHYAEVGQVLLTHQPRGVIQFIRLPSCSAPFPACLSAPACQALYAAGYSLVLIFFHSIQCSFNHCKWLSACWREAASPRSDPAKRFPLQGSVLFADPTKHLLVGSQPRMQIHFPVCWKSLSNSLIAGGNLRGALPVIAC